ncbi:MAG: AEC family transporter, partial [Firmicutes bacterium]|nr:AEC family transporter [Bacillota bacterium]
WRREIWGVLGHRLFLSPLVGILVLAFFPLPPDLSGVLLLMLSMPPLVTTALVASSYDADQDLAAMGVVIPTLLSLVTVPLLLLLKLH